MATHNIILQGAGGHARVVMDAAFAQGHTVVGIYDPQSMGEVYGIPVNNVYRSDDFANAKMVVAIGDNAVRRKVAEASHHTFANIIHPSAVMSPYTSLGNGNVILHGAIVQAESVIGNHVILNTGSQVDHHCEIQDFVHLAPGVILCGKVKIGEGSFIGAGAIIIPGKKVGAWSVVGAGAVVIEDVPEGVVVVGNPGRVVKWGVGSR